MNILAIDTTGRLASVALLTSDGRLFQESSTDEMSHLKSLVPMAAAVLKNAGIKKSDLTHIAVSAGPGSFTGIRIGVATAKTLAQALGLPVYAVSSLESFVYAGACAVTRALGADSAPGAAGVASDALCSSASVSSGTATPLGEAPSDLAPRAATGVPGSTSGAVSTSEANGAPDEPRALICPMLDARRREVYSAAYTADGTPLLAPDARAVEDYARAALDAAASRGLDVVSFYGDGVDKYEEVVDTAAAAGEKRGITVEKASADVRYQQAAYVALAAAAHPEDATGYNEVEPIYLRKAYAQTKLEEDARKKAMEAAKSDEEKKKSAETVWELPAADEVISYHGAAAEDIPAMAELDALCFTRAWSEAAFEGDMSDGKNWIYTIAKNPKGKVIGFAGLTYVIDEAEINRVAVHPLYRGRGIADEMMHRILAEAAGKGLQAFTLEVREANRSAIALYKNHGFAVEAKREGYYAATGENALIMWKRN